MLHSLSTAALFLYQVCVSGCNQFLLRAGKCMWGTELFNDMCCALFIFCSPNNASKSRCEESCIIVIMTTERQVTEVSSDQLFESLFSIIDVLGLLTEGLSLENVMLYYCANCCEFYKPWRLSIVCHWTCHSHPK